MTSPTSPASPAPPRGPRLQTPHWIAIVTAAVAIAVVAVVLIDRPGGSGNSKAASPATGVAAGASSNVIVSPVAGVASELATSSAAGSGQATTTTSTANGGQPGQPTRPAQPTATGHPTPAPTVTATATATVTATATATSAPTTTPTSTPTPTPTKLRPIPTRIIFPLKLNPDATGVYGDVNLSGAFTPDPHSVPMSSAGGSIATSYLGGSCSGYASASPDLRVNYGGGSSLLRLYYVSTNGDPAMVVRDPYGNFYCVNDSFGTVSPTIDFNNPASGAYAIWICSPTSGATLTGTMYATRTTPNHP